MSLTGTFVPKEPSPHPLHGSPALRLGMVTLISLDQPGRKPTKAVWAAYRRMADVPTLDVLTDLPKVDVQLDPPGVQVIVISPIVKRIHLSQPRASIVESAEDGYEMMM